MSAAIVDKFMDMIGINHGDDGYDNEQYEEVETEVENYEVQPTRSKRSFNDIESNNPFSSRNIQSKVIPMNTAISSSKMVITQPTCFEDVQELGNYLKDKRSVIVNLENISKEDARRVLDFLTGAAFMIEGTMQRVSNLIYLMTPRNVEIQNDVERNQYKQQKSSFTWLKQ